MLADLNSNVFGNICHTKNLGRVFTKFFLKRIFQLAMFFLMLNGPTARANFLVFHLFNIPIIG